MSGPNNFGLRGPRRSGRELRYGSNLEFGQATRRNILGSGTLSKNDVLVLWNEPAPGVEREIELPPLGDVELGHTIYIATGFGDVVQPASVRIAQNAADAGTKRINGIWESLILVAVNEAVMLQKTIVDFPAATNVPIWEVLSEAPRGSIDDAVARYTPIHAIMAEITAAGTVIAIPVAGNFQPWSTGTLAGDGAAYFSNNAGRIELAKPAFGLYKITANASIVGVPNAVVDMSITVGNGNAPVNGIGGLAPGGIASCAFSAAPLRKNLSTEFVLPMGLFGSGNEMIGLAFTSDNNGDTVSLIQATLAIHRI